MGKHSSTNNKKKKIKIRNLRLKLFILALIVFAIFGFLFAKNLNDLELLPEEFELLWKLQELLNTYDLYKTQLSKNMYDTLENIKTLYSNLFKEEI